MQVLSINNIKTVDHYRVCFNTHTLHNTMLVVNTFASSYDTLLKRLHATAKERGYTLCVVRKIQRIS